MGNVLPAETPDAYADRRRHRRVALNLQARYMLPDKSEHEGSVIDMSAGGMSINSDIKPDFGTRLIIYVQDFGRLEATVVRHHDLGFAGAFENIPGLHDRVMDKLTLLLNRDRLPDMETRLYPRLPTRDLARLTLKDGTGYDCKILDMSFGGISIAVALRPALGEEVTIGRTHGRVVRHHEHGIAIAFDRVHASWGSLALSLR